MPKPTPATTPSFQSYSTIQEQNRELLRQNLVDAASHLLMSEGPEALTVRRIADTLQCSTKVIYTMFDGKDGLANELYLEGCERLRQSIEAVPVDDNLYAYMVACCWAYWAFAQTHPSYYLVMFSNAIPHFHPNKNSLDGVATAFGILVLTLERYRAQSDTTLNTHEMIHLIWSALHGVISLYQQKHFSDDEAKNLYQKTIDAIIAYVLK